MPNLNTEILSRIPLNLPPLAEQRRIAELLGSLDDKIELNRHMAATLEEMARALFKSWFVDFDPVRAKAEADLRASQMRLQSYSRRALRMMAYRRGGNPKEVKHLFDLVGGGTPLTNSSEYWEGDIPWFSIADAPLASARLFLKPSVPYQSKVLRAVRPLFCRLEVQSSQLVERLEKWELSQSPMASINLVMPRSKGLTLGLIYLLLAGRCYSRAYRRSHGIGLLDHYKANF